VGGSVHAPTPRLAHVPIAGRVHAPVRTRTVGYGGAVRRIVPGVAALAAAVAVMGAGGQSGLGGAKATVRAYYDDLAAGRDTAACGAARPQLHRAGRPRAAAQRSRQRRRQGDDRAPDARQLRQGHRRRDPHPEGRHLRGLGGSHRRWAARRRGREVQPLACPRGEWRAHATLGRPHRRERPLGHHRLRVAPRVGRGAVERRRSRARLRGCAWSCGGGSCASPSCACGSWSCCGCARRRDACCDRRSARGRWCRSRSP